MIINLGTLPVVNIGDYRALHLDGHQTALALHYARVCCEANILTSLDGGGIRGNTIQVLRYIDVAVRAERMCEQLICLLEKCWIF